MPRKTRTNAPGAVHHTKKLGVLQASVSISAKRGEKIAKTKKLELLED